MINDEVYSAREPPARGHVLLDHVALIAANKSLVSPDIIWNLTRIPGVHTDSALPNMTSEYRYLLFYGIVTYIPNMIYIPYKLYMRHCKNPWVSLIELCKAPAIIPCTISLVIIIKLFYPDYH
jgi:hypothetical protein